MDYFTVSLITSKILMFILFSTDQSAIKFLHKKWHGLSQFIPFLPLLNSISLPTFFGYRNAEDLVLQRPQVPLSCKEEAPSGSGEKGDPVSKQIIQPSWLSVGYRNRRWPGCWSDLAVALLRRVSYGSQAGSEPMGSSDHVASALNAVTSFQHFVQPETDCCICTYTISRTSFLILEAFPQDYKAHSKSIFMS